MKYASDYIFYFILGLCIFIPQCSGNQSSAISEQYEYDQEGRLVCRIALDGSRIEYKYNQQGLPIEISYPNDVIRYGYDANGNRILMQSKAGTTEYKYDAFERLVEVISKYSPEKRVIYEYDPWNRITLIKIIDAFNNSYQIKYEYNILGYLTAIDDGNGRIEYSYLPDRGEIIRHLPNGTITVFSYSASGDLISIKHSRQNNIFAAYSYEYTPLGKISHVIEETPEGTKITNFEWDNRGYLKTLQLPDGNNIHYEYDSMGNRISMTDSKGTIAYTYDKFGRITKAGDIKYEWDKNGNLATQIDKNSRTQFRYDTRNLPLLIKTPSELVHFKWDGDGNMVSEKMGKDITYYLPDPLSTSSFALAEFDETGRLKSSYIYSDSLLGQRDANGKIKYFLEDGFNSIRQITDVNGKIIGQQDFTPFAEPTTTKGVIADDFRMIDERFLPEMKKSLIGNRLYDPFIARYISPDPDSGYLERPDSFNRYTTHGDPDPDHFMEPRINQTTKLLDTFEKQIVRGAISEGIKTYSKYSLKEAYAAYGRQWGPLFEKLWGDKGWQYGNAFGTVVTGTLGTITFWQDLWTNEENRISQGSQAYSMEFWEDWGKSGLKLIGSAQGGLAGGIMGTLIGEGTDAISTFYGTRMDRPYWWWSPMKWIPQDEYLRRLEDQGKRQAALAADADRAFKKSYKDDNKKYFKGPDWPDGGGGGGISGNGGPFNTGFYDPFTSLEVKLGGIKLDATAQFAGNLGNIIGAVYDQEKQVMVLLGDEDLSLPSIKPEELAVALMLVYGQTPQDPQFTLDPADPKNPKGEWLKAVYIPEQIIGSTEFGKALFDADWLLKQYSFGVKIDEKGKLLERESSVSGFKSTATLSLEKKDSEYGKESWNRFWIVSDDMKLKRSGKSIYFDIAKMRVKSRKIMPDPNSSQGFRDVDSEDDLIAMEFADLFTELYDQIAKESPEFERVRQLAKAVAIAKWMKQEGVQIDIEWVNEYANKRIDSVGKITALSTQWEKTSQSTFQEGNQTGILTQTYRLYLFGGVDLTVKPEYTPGDETTQNTYKLVTEELQRKDASAEFDIELDNKWVHAAVLPVTKAGQNLWENSPSVVVDGTRYEFNNQKRIIKSVDSDKNITEYIWDSNDKLSEFKTAIGGGWLLSGSKKDDYSELVISSPSQNKFIYRYAPSGNLQELLVDGKSYAKLEYRDDKVIIDYANYLEQLKYDNSGRVEYYEIQPYNGASDKRQFVEINYDNDGNISSYSSPDVGTVEYIYDNGNIKTLNTSQGKMDYEYDINTGFLKDIHTTWGESIKYDYDGDSLTRISYVDGNYHSDAIFENGSLVEISDVNGQLTRYQYKNTDLLEKVIDSDGETAEYSYDEQGWLKEIRLPDASSIKFKYESQTINGRKDVFPKKVQVTYSAGNTASSSVDFKDRLADIKEAASTLQNGLILDIYVDEKGNAYSNIVDTERDVYEIDTETSRELKRLINITSKTEGKLGKTILKQWEHFYDAYLASRSIPEVWTCPDGKEVKLKPALIIKSNQVTYKYGNLEKVPVLADNFVFFVASKRKVSVDSSESSAKELVNKINNIPKLTRENTAFIIRLPKMSEEQQQEWYKEISELQQTIGEQNVLVDPTKEELNQMLQNRNKDIVVVELTHTNKGILLKDNERYTSEDVLAGGDLSHIKFLLSGLGTCRLSRLENGNLVTSLREKGVGIINASFGDVSSETALERLRELIYILNNDEGFEIYPYYMLDIINQRLEIIGRDTINLGELYKQKDSLFG